MSADSLWTSETTSIIAVIVCVGSKACRDVSFVSAVVYLLVWSTCAYCCVTYHSLKSFVLWLQTLSENVKEWNGWVTTLAAVVTDLQYILRCVSVTFRPFLWLYSLHTFMFTHILTQSSLQYVAVCQAFVSFFERDFVIAMFFWSVHRDRSQGLVIIRKHQRQRLLGRKCIITKARGRATFSVSHHRGLRDCRRREVGIHKWRCLAFVLTFTLI